MKSNNTFLYYALSVFESLDFTRGIFILFLLQRGLSTREIGALQTVLFMMCLCFDVPTGIIADRFKRKYSLIIGYGLVALSAFLMLHARGFTAFAGLFALQGLGFAFKSGAGSALVYDDIKESGLGWSPRYLRISSIMRALNSIALALAIGSGPWLIGRDWGWTYDALGCAMVASALIACMIKEDRRARDPSIQAPERKCPGLIDEIVRFTKMAEGRRLLLFIAGMALLEAAHTPFFIFMQIQLKEKLGDVRLVGLVVAGAILLASTSYLWVNRLSSIGLRVKICGTFFLVSLLLSLFVFDPSAAVTVALYWAINCLPTLLYLFTDKFINDSIPSEIRASYLSIHSAATSVAISTSYLVLGFAMERVPAHLAFSALGLLPFAGMLLFGLARRRLPLGIAAEAGVSS